MQLKHADQILAEEKHLPIYKVRILNSTCILSLALLRGPVRLQTGVVLFCGTSCHIVRLLVRATPSFVFKYLFVLAISDGFLLFDALTGMRNLAKLLYSAPGDTADGRIRAFQTPGCTTRAISYQICCRHVPPKESQMIAMLCFLFCVNHADSVDNLRIHQ